jgi:uncharacterized protein YndB with AHSA1/START domain
VSAPRIATLYVVFENEVTFAAPREQAWPHVLAYPTWQTYSRVEHVSGEPGGEGEVVLLEKDGYPFPIRAQTIKLDPGRRFMGKVGAAEPSEGNDWFGFVDFRLEDAEGGSSLRVNSVYEHRVPYEDARELAEFHAAQAAVDETFKTSLQKLKALVEGLERESAVGEPAGSSAALVSG